MPELPGGEGLQEKHLETVLHVGTILGPSAHEERLVWVVDQVVEDGVRVHRLIGQVRTLLRLRIHA